MNYTEIRREKRNDRMSDSGTNNNAITISFLFFFVHGDRTVVAAKHRQVINVSTCREYWIHRLKIPAGISRLAEYTPARARNVCVYPQI